MKLLYVADGRSPIALNWISYFIEHGAQVHLISLFPGAPPLELASFHHIPVAFSGAARSGGQFTGQPGLAKSILRWAASPRLRTYLRQRAVPRSLPGAAETLIQLLDEIQPDLVHAMRLPFEGMVAALAAPKAPLLISIWGNDFTLHAASTNPMASLTRQALLRADALHTDCLRDRRLATEWGFPAERPAIVLPGGGGVQPDLFFPPKDSPETLAEKLAAPTIINPRGLRAYVCSESFFRAVPMILDSHPQARFLCPGMAGEPEPRRWLRKFGGERAVELLPSQTRTEMAALFRRSQVAVSPTLHDGTPNTLLEAMACGCFPTAGDIESLREWITPGVNGALFDPQDPGALSEAVNAALADPQALLQARAFNQQLIRERATYHQVMETATRFYRHLLSRQQPTET